MTIYTEADVIVAIVEEALYNYKRFEDYWIGFDLHGNDELLASAVELGYLTKLNTHLHYATGYGMVKLTPYLEL